MIGGRKGGSLGCWRDLCVGEDSSVVVMMIAIAAVRRGSRVSVIRFERRRRDLRHSVGRQGEAKGTEISTKRAFESVETRSQ